jgi:DNA-binding FadR family transcriptional regulator
MKELVQRDLDFHIALTRAPGNPVLAEIGAKFLFQLFAFIQIGVLTSEQGPDAWIGDLPNHRLVQHMISEGNPILAGQCVQHCIRPFAASAYAVWENVEGSIEAHHNGQRSRGRKG